MAYHHKKVAVVIPAFNEADSIAKVVRDVLALREFPGTNQLEPLVDDVIVCDNGSTDNTANLALEAGARVVYEGIAGYGAACLTAIEALKNPDIVVFIDGDRSVLANETIQLLEKVCEGADLVIGARVSAKREKYALTPQQWFGNVLASALIRLIWHEPVTDLGPFRAIRYSALRKLHMSDPTFGWTTEMQVKAIQLGMDMREVPVSTLRRIGQSKISGTVKGTIGAAIGIFGMIFRLYNEEKANQDIPSNH